MWAKVENGKVTGTSANAPPTNEAGKPEPGWEERSENDPAVKAYYEEQNNPPPSSAPEALWDEFRSRIASPTYLRIVTTNAITQALNPILISRLGRAETNAEALNDLMTTWNMIATHAKPTVLEIAELNKIAFECKMPFRLDIAGKMVAI
ncbi:hypothetical protein IFO70_10435 [Phormidium tenue FACHB-886]|nr:hypothetical protein [Phormidium tenue FACHB-886]